MNRYHLIHLFLKPLNQLNQINVAKVKYQVPLLINQYRKRVDHQQNHQKFLKEDSQLKIIFDIIIALTTKVNQIRILIFYFLKINEERLKN